MPEAFTVSMLREVFSLTRFPLNVRVANWLGQTRLARGSHLLKTWIMNWAIGTRWVSHDGSFAYKCGSSRRNIIFDGRNLQFHALYEPHYENGYELETSLLITTLCRGDAVFYDVGSNWGYFSLLLAAMPDFKGRIFAFEPNPKVFADLRTIVEQAALTARIEICHCGLGSRTCHLTLESDPFKTGLGRLVAHGRGPTVVVHRLDGLSLPAPTLIKIDAEGMEVDVMLGAKRTLEESRPIMLFESILYHACPRQTTAPMDILSHHHYRLFVPALVFIVDSQPVVAPYGVDTRPLVKVDSSPQVGLFELSRASRFLMKNQMNIVGVPEERMEAIWQCGIIDLQRCT